MSDSAETPTVQVKEFENDDEFYQGEVLPNTETKHGTGTQVSKAEMAKYFGGFKDGKRHGDGQLEWIDPETPFSEFMGAFADGVPHGMGIITCRNNRTYKGDFQKGKPTEGMVEYPDKSEYCGGVNLVIERDGYGQITYADGETWVGEWRDDKRQGKGMHTKGKVIIEGVYVEDVLIMGQRKVDDEVFFGEFNPAGEYHGKGQLTYMEGKEYMGGWANGLHDGWGTYRDSTSVFEGRWKEGRKEQGTLKYENGDSYIGTFTEDGMKDCGVFSYSNGDEYSGAFLNGAREMGLCVYKSTGNVYKGSYQDGLPHGSGELVTTEGDIYKGEFERGLKNG